MRVLLLPVIFFSLFFASAFSPGLCLGEDAGAVQGYSPLTNLPGDIVSDYKVYAGEVFQKKNIWPAVGLAASTGLLIYYDEELTAEAKRFGRKLGLGNTDRTKAFVKIGGLPILRGPTDTGSALYFLGDGWTHFSITAGFYAYGYLAGNSRAVRTGYALLEGLGSTAVLTQIMKRSTGRQSEYVATGTRGEWHFFPDQSEYNKHVASYDAFPSGHLATAMMTVTVISTNYPEYPAIAPVGYGLMTLLGFQMMNNGVHWASDYPLAISIGYSLGKISALRSQGKLGAAAKKEGSVFIYPDLGPGYSGLLAAKKI